MTGMNIYLPTLINKRINRITVIDHDVTDRGKYLPDIAVISRPMSRNNVLISSRFRRESIELMSSVGSTVSLITASLSNRDNQVRLVLEWMTARED